MRTITRTTNPNGTYRYEIDGEVQYKASRVRYTHASAYRIGSSDPVLFHRTEAAANKASGYREWVKVGVLAIEDGDAAPATDDPRCVTCVAHPGWAHGNEAKRREPADICKDCLGSGLESVAKDRRTPASATVDLWETYQGETHGYDRAGNRVIEISERTRPNAWNGHTSSNRRNWAVLGDGATRHGVLASGTADGLRAAKRAALAAWAEVMATPAPEAPKVPRVRAKVVVNAGPSHLRGRQGRVESKDRGDDGELYVTVEFEPGVTWPFLVSELTLV
jgi:hypothetical protein